MPATNKHELKTPIAIRNPNGTIMCATEAGDLDMPLLPSKARKAYIVPALDSTTLISIGQLCDAGCEAIFTASALKVYHQERLVLQGKRSQDTKLWHLSLPAKQHSERACHVGNTGPAELVTFTHAALFSPAISTLQKALDNNWITNFPGLTSKSLKKYPPKDSKAMHKGHMDQARKNQRSTKPKSNSPTPADPVDLYPDQEQERTHFIYVATFEPTGQIYTDQTGRFLTPSTTGNQYVMILYDYDTNIILANPYKTKGAKDLVESCKTLHRRICKSGYKPKLQRLDNECPDALKQFMDKEHIDYQLAPPHVHRRNAAERAIRTFKNHFIAGLCSVDAKFPLCLWDELVPQGELTLNLMRGSRINPKLSAWAQVNGHYDFNRNPIAPPGIRVLVHEKPAQRKSWSPHAVDGWYVGPALESHRCYKVWIWETRKVRTCDTVSWFPDTCRMPTATSTDVIRAGVADIAEALKNPSPGSPLAPLTDTQTQALKTLVDIFKQHDPVKKPSNDAEPDDPTVRTSNVHKTKVTTPDEPPALHQDDDMSLDCDETLEDETALPPTQAPAASQGVPTTIAAPSPAPAQGVSKTTPPTTHQKATQCRKRTATKKTGAPPLHTAAALTAIIDAHENEYHAAFHGNAFNPDTNQIAEHPELITCSEGHLWKQGCADEIGRLAQGHQTMPKGTDTIRFVHRKDVPKGKQVTHVRIVAAHRPEKVQPHRVRWTVGGDKIDFSGDVSTKTAELSTCKILMNSVISTKGARCCTTDVKNYYLKTDLAPEDWVYIRIAVHLVPEAIMDFYNLWDKVHNGYVYAVVQKGMYGLKQAGRIANDQLVRVLAPHGYHPCAITPGLWRHATNGIAFCLIVDDFIIKYTEKLAATHLLNILEQEYEEISTDWNASQFAGVTLEWDYDKRTVDISMPGHIERVLKRFQHPIPARPQHSPYLWTQPQCGQTMQHAEQPDDLPVLDAKDIKRVMAILGALLFYARAVDMTMLTAIGTIATEQTQATESTMRKITQLLNYCATHPEAVVRFHASDMVLWVDSDGSYLSVPKGRSRAGGHHYLSNWPKEPDKPPGPDDPPVPHNGPIHVLCQIMREVLSSAAETELGALFHNGKEACPLRTALEELGHPQPPTPLQTDNSTAAGIANDSIKQKRSKAIDMRFYWVRDRCRQGQFHVYWRRGANNKADYFTKHHSAKHHKDVRPMYLHQPTTETNYYAVLADEDEERDDSPTTHAQPHTTDTTDSGGGVLISGSPAPSHDTTGLQAQQAQDIISPAQGPFSLGMTQSSGHFPYQLSESELSAFLRQNTS